MHLKIYTSIDTRHHRKKTITGTVKAIAPSHMLITLFIFEVRITIYTIEVKVDFN